MSRRERRPMPVGAIVLALLLTAVSCSRENDAPAAAVAGPPPDPSWIGHMESARELQRRGDLQGSLGAATRALVAAPTLPEPWAVVSQLYVDLGDDASAAEFFGIAARNYPGSARPWFYRGYHEFRLNRWDAALEAFRTARELDPADAQSAFREGLVLQATGDFDGALTALARARELDPRAAVIAARLSRVLRITGSYEDAERVVTEALAASPDSSDLHYALGQLRLRESRHDEAEEALRRAVALNPMRPDARDDLARVLARTGREDEARRERLRAERLRDYVDSRSSLLRVVARRPEDPEAVLALAELDLSERNAAAAAAGLRRAEELAGRSSRIVADAVELALLSGDLAGAEGEARGLGDPGEPRTALALAGLYLARGERDAGLERLGVAVDGGPEDRAFLRRAADLYERAGMIGRWEELLARASAIRSVLADEGAEGMKSTGP